MAKIPSGKNINCKNCNISFYVPKHRIHTAMYCSRRCKAKFNLIKVKTNCHICNNEFEHIESRCNKAKYCSRQCYYIAMSKKGSKEYTCKHCSKKFHDAPSKNRIYCSRECSNKETLSEFKPSFQTVRKSMLRRNMLDKCESCGYSEHKEILGIHHKNRNRNDNSLNNLMILCPNCHSIEHKKHISH